MVDILTTWMHQKKGIRTKNVHDSFLNYRYTPLDYAKQNHHSKCIKLLEENGGLTVHEIKTIAAICIQTLYRKHRQVYHSIKIISNV